MEARKPQVVVIENNPAIRNAIGRLLIASGYATELYESAERFLERDCKVKMDCLVLDIDLGGMSGFELQKNLVEAGFPIPIIFIDAQNDARAIANAIDEDGAAYLQRPFEPQLMFSALETGLNMHAVSNKPRYH